MANTLFYCGFDLEAGDLAAQAPLLAPLNMNLQLENMKTFLPNLVPLIGGVTIHGKRCGGNNKKKRPITWTDLFTDLSPYPTLVVPIRTDTGKMTHAFCVVDNLIFDSTTPHALKLKMDSVNWIFNHKPVDIFMALRFDQKVSPKGNRVRGKYKISWIDRLENRVMCWRRSIGTDSQHASWSSVDKYEHIHER